MKIYDLNILEGVHVTETIIQLWEYKGRIIQGIGGNCFGKTILNSDLQTEDNALKSDCNLRYDEDYGVWKADLHDRNGNIMEIEVDHKRIINMIVKIEIIGHFDTIDKMTKFVNGIHI